MFKKISALVIGLCVLQAPAWGTHGGREVAIPVSNTEVALSMIYSNPPLPMGYFEPGDYKFTALMDYLAPDKPA